MGDNVSIIGFLLYYAISLLATFIFGVVVGVVGGVLHARKCMKDSQDYLE